MNITTEPARLAINGGPKAFPQRTGKPQPKIGVEEFISIAERFGFKPEAIERIRHAVADGDLLENGPNLAKYLSTFPRPSKSEQFEALARTKFGVPYALGVSSGTAALHCAMVAVGAGPGKEVIVPAVGFLATSMSAALVGAKPVFCDVDESLQLDPQKLESLITPRTVAVAPTHYAGFICDMDPILRTARAHGIKVIEDCAQAPGGRYKGRYVGTVGDIGCFSISAYKIIGGGESGLAIVNDERLFDRVQQMSEAGGLWRTNRFAPERYEGELFAGTNYRMSELEAAVNLIQLEKLDDVVARFRKLSRRVLGQVRRFREIRWQKSNDPDGDIGYAVRFYADTPGLARKLADALRAEGLAVGIRAQPASPDWHLYTDMIPLFHEHADQCRPELCPVAVQLFNEGVGIWFDQWYSPEDCDAIAAGLNKVFAAYCTQAASR